MKQLPCIDLSWFLTLSSWRGQSPSRASSVCRKGYNKFCISVLLGTKKIKYTKHFPFLPFFARFQLVQRPTETTRNPQQTHFSPARLLVQHGGRTRSKECCSIFSSTLRSPHSAVEICFWKDTPNLPSLKLT